MLGTEAKGLIALASGDQAAFHFLKINHDRVKSAPQF
jgi:hypothetical protein